MEAQSECNLKLKFGERIFEHHGIVARMKEEIILGLSFMEENGPKLHLKAGMMYVKDQRVPLLNRMYKSENKSGYLLHLQRK